MISAGLILVFVFFVFLGGFFAGSETGVYQLSRLRLRLGIEKRQLSYVILGKSLADSSALLVSMLIGTNLAHYGATSVATYMFLKAGHSDHAAELLATVAIAPILFVFSEIVPKSLFLYRADFLMPRVAVPVFVSHKLLSWCGMVPLLKGLSGLFAGLSRSRLRQKAVISATHKPHIKAILRDTREEAFLSSVQTDIIERLVGISNTSIRSVMVPINKTEMVEVASDKAALQRKLDGCAFTRLLVYERTRSNVTGFVNIYDALCSSEQFTDLRKFTRPIQELQAVTTVADAINIMQHEKQKIMLVTKTTGAGTPKPVGIVTMKDLVEELLGELTEW